MDATRTITSELLTRDDLPLGLAIVQEVSELDDPPGGAVRLGQPTDVRWRTWVQTSPGDNDQANIDHHFD
ncbi:hypothetical protein [Streptomyces sp. NRRL B-24484]|uniref:hypothetical protein n=1 Tax=Streptomyces sp. NRRL B-24484 TaxID=1463833 RepID=UPI001331749F|nr:hypothetical protein [Streptomyces sp. NRRL B-24484]